MDDKFVKYGFTHIQCPEMSNDQPERPNILFITADDMNYDSPGACGCGISNITPYIDQLAREGIRFENAHVNIAVCMPSRETLMTGRYPHRSGGEGFQPIAIDVPTLQEQLSKAGYVNGIMGKETHLAPREKFCWDFLVTMEQLGRGREPGLYNEYAREFFQNAKREGRNFFLMANSHDPHRPFAGSQQEREKWGNDPPGYNRKIDEEEVEVPGFLPDIPDVRKEIAEYFTSVHRCDESVGAVIEALKEIGLYESTLIMFLSDNGMALPFAKTNCYLNSTKTPWIVSWPGRVKPKTVDRKHFISGIDYMPTILEAAGLPSVPGMDGFSFLPLLFGEDQAHRSFVFTEFHETAANRRYPMRCIQDREYGYIFNFWADSETVFRNESQNGRTFKAMKVASESNDQIRDRLDLFLYRVQEEFYYFRDDPNALENLACSEERDRIEKYRSLLADWMRRTSDPALEAFENRGSTRSIERFMEKQREKARINHRRKLEARRK